MEDPEERPIRSRAGSPVQPLPARGGRPAAWLPLALLAAVVAGALLGSWASGPAQRIVGPPSPGGSGPTRPGSPRAGVPADAPTAEAADAYADLVVTCGYPSGWRAATLQHWLGRETPIRTWTAEDPVAARDATDPAIPFAPVATDLVLAIGYCSPVGPGQPPQGVGVEMWAVPGEGPPARLAPELLEPPDANALGGLWLPPPDRRVAIDGRTGWSPGRYALRLVARSFDRWLGVEIEDISRLRPPAGTGPPPGASPGASDRPAASG